MEEGLSFPYILTYTSCVIPVCIFQIRTNKDGSKTQVVRQYGCNTSSATEPEQSVTYEKNSYVYINEAPGGDGTEEGTPADHLLPVPLSEDTASIRMRGEDRIGTDHDPFDLPRGNSSSSTRGIGLHGSSGRNFWKLLCTVIIQKLVRLR